METSEEEEVDQVLKDAPLSGSGWAVDSSGINAKRPWGFVEVLKVRRGFIELDRSIVYKIDVDFQLKEEGEMVEGRGLITICPILRSTEKKERGNIYIYLETSSTEVSWN